jgi:tripartite-type tricarboxylate transporter receptor subunit TctC
MNIHRLATRSCAGFIVVATGATAVFAQAAFPSKPIRLVVPFAAGGPSDVVARTLGQKLGENLRQQIIVDVRTGAGGNIASEIVSKAPPDGYTLLSGTVGTHAINPSLYSNMPFDTVKDFAPVTLIVTSTLVLVAHPSIPAKSISDLVALAKAMPGRLNFASPSSGSPHHLAGELLNRIAGIKMVHIPYKGAAPALADVLGGQVQLGIVGLPAALPHIKAGKLTALGVTSAKRAAAAPDVPAIGETFRGYEVDNWQGIFAPPATPKDIVSLLNVEIAKALDAPEVKERLFAQGFDTLNSTPERFAAYVKTEVVKWAKIVKESGARAD